MTYAICPSCGEDKVGALTYCRKCNYRPKTEQEVDQSLLLTDHYLSYGKLRAIGRNIKNNQQVDLNYYFMPTWKRLCWNVLKPLGLTARFEVFFKNTEVTRIKDK